ncbi:hypothetical protein [Mangrovibacillus cuniculi]|uniref:Uncharacterized protein n=1 Tax=Mangrovibacillus cuniculi TaxID=2593652 RepID=A0A7S8HF77_9BACI|nr:hypothetical protein [Mangrovibacillus cuniculi]QPC46624.1 hypothetical protein G8O30_06445 [Mangrovibacillus cuniculi]
MLQKNIFLLFFQWVSEQRVIWIDFVLFSVIFSLLFQSLFSNSLQVLLFGLSLYLICSSFYMVFMLVKFLLKKRRASRHRV